jgi:predicted PurR-regulated permease PerM
VDGQPLATRIGPREVASHEARTPEARDRYTARVFIALGLTAALIALWRAADVVMIAFGAVLLAVALRALARIFERYTPLPGRAALPGAILAVVASLGLVAWLVGDTLAGELGQLATRLPAALDKVRDWLAMHAAGRAVLDSLGAVNGAESVSRLAGAAISTLGAVANALVLLVLGIYFAVDPGLYRRGFLRLVPSAHRARVAETLGAAADALRDWLGGAVVAMLAVGTVTGLGLWALGVPFALSLAVIAALLEFVPFLGPLVAAIPAILVGFSESPVTAIYVALLYLTIQQIEGYLLTPLVQRWAVSLPPALAVLAVLVFGVLIGLPGVLFAVPLLVVVMVVVRKLYVEPAEAAR